MQLAIVKEGKIIKTSNYGFANLQDSIVVSDKTLFTINSITKAFTGVAIVQLVEAGKLTLSSPYQHTRSTEADNRSVTLILHTGENSFIIKPTNYLVE